MKSLIIEFKKMELTLDKNTVWITCNSFGHEVIIELSILQLAKIFGSDAENVSDVENDFGSEEYEDKCEETRKLVKKFPDVKVWNNEIEFGYVSVSSDKWDKDFLKKFPEKEEKSVFIYGEDIVGWNNEGIRIRLPLSLYDKFLANEKFKIIAEPFSVKFILEKK